MYKSNPSLAEKQTKVKPTLRVFTKRCPDCHGVGYLIDNWGDLGVHGEACSTCRGNGSVSMRRAE